MASKNDVDELSRTLITYAPMSHLKSLKDDVNDFVKKEDFNITARELEYLKKDLGKLCSKEEIMTRLNVFNSDMNTKMMDRPTI
jgi:Ca2+-binding EF-hand superfamily protein